MLRFLVPSLLAIAFLANTLQPCFSEDDNSRKKVLYRQFLKEAGTIDGAIWYFELTPSAKTPKKHKPIRGAYRVLDLKLYQAAKPGEEMTTQIGESHPGPKAQRTIMEFTALRGKTAPSKWIEPVSGKAVLARVKFGEGKGTFVDSEGLRWKMQTKRIRE